ncbi:MAG: AAA family ATPase [Planctomycetes bacterium]|nr:AAA family ATPase [Planctomycetota bacterium]
MTRTLQEQVELLIRARYPILYLVSWEETLVRDMVAEIAKKRNKKLYEWSATIGITPAGTPIQSQKGRNQATRDPLVALDQIIDQVEPALFLLHDFHPFLQKNNFAVIRRLKEIAIHLKNSHKTLLVVGPVLEVPPELEKEITVLDCPLPTTAELSTVLDRMVDEQKDNRRVQIDLDAGGREQLLRAALGLTITEAENVFAKILVSGGRLSGADVPEVFAEKQQVLRKSGLLEYYESREEFGQVGGLEHLKEWLRKREAALSDRARAFGLPAPRGAQLLGVQGCGKSLCAKAVSGLWKLPLLRLDVGRMFGSLVGSSEENMRRAIRIAESVAPAILWIDEMDKALAGSGGSASTDGGTTARVFGTLLTWLSEKTSPVFVIATANDIAHLPPELLRKGRFDEIFFVDLPSEEERREIFGIHLTRRGRAAKGFDLARLAGAAQGFSGAEIEEAIVSALFDVFSAGKELETADVLTAIGATVPLSRTMEEGLSRLRAWAEGRARPASARRAGADGRPGAENGRRLEF